MFNTREKRERSLGAKLFLKASRCNSPKCVTVRRPSRPGLHGSARRRAPSEFSSQLQEKQRVKAVYGIREAQMRLVVEEAARNPGITGEMIMSLLERRLDNVVYRIGLAPSRSVARQLVGHGHILVNGRRNSIPSYRVRVGDAISIRPASANHPIFRDLKTTLPQAQIPAWLSLDAEKCEGKVLMPPKDLEMPFDVGQIVDYYSK